MQLIYSSIPLRVEADAATAMPQAAGSFHDVSQLVLKALAFFFHLPTYTFINALLDDEMLQPDQQPSSLLHVISYKQQSSAAAAQAGSRGRRARRPGRAERGVVTAARLAGMMLLDCSGVRWYMLQRPPKYRTLAPRCNDWSYTCSRVSSASGARS